MNESLEQLEVRISNIEERLEDVRQMLCLLTEDRRKALPRLMTQRQVESYLKISRYSIKKLVADGVLTPLQRIGKKQNEPIRYKTRQVLALAGYEK